MAEPLTPQQIADAVIAQMSNPFVADKKDLATWQECVDSIYTIYVDVLTPPTKNMMNTSKASSIN